MRYKAKVLAQIPNATPVVIRRWPDQEPKYVAIYNGKNGHVRMDTNVPDAIDLGWGGESQLHNAAWRSAYFWLIRDKKAKV
jgi:hypothetical protein